jgi:5,10-methylene-tetrahydrofolate dehydrogenase/methenyl tetrahydrofolate cyclohydrolase
MATTQLIDGKAISEQVLSEITNEVQALKAEKNIVPGLATVLVGQRKDSQTYVRMKQRAAARCGFFTVDVHLEDDVTEEKLLEEVDALNQRADVHGILVQLPLPKHINEAKVLKRVLVRKDVDGFSAENMGNIALLGGAPKAVPCTPAGVIELLKRTGVQIQGKKAVVLGRSNIVGLPVSLLLMRLDATVTIVHSRTQNIDAEVRNADIVIAAIGKPEFVRGSWLKPGCTVIDVGINFIEDKTKASGHRMVGDVCFEEAKGIASYLTPVPGGVGPMTIAMLMKNTLNLARLEEN